MCEAVDLPVHFGVVVVGVVFCPLFGQSQLRCPNNLHLKHLPSFMRCVCSLIDMRSMSMALGSFFSGKENFFCAGDALEVFTGLSRFLKRHCALWCPTLKFVAFVYHSSSVFGGCSDQIIGLCRLQGSVSRYKSINAGESFIPVCDTKSWNFELCSVILPSPRCNFFMSSSASAGSSYGWNVFLRASTNSLYVPQFGSSLFASSFSSILV
jgi:hypothetical protein